MKLFFDRNFPRGLARAVKEVCGPHRNVEVTCHDDRFAQDTADTVWITRIAEDSPKPFVIGGDGAILRNPAEALALKESGLTYFLLAKRFTSLPIYDQAWKFFKALPDIMEFAAKVTAAAVFEISVNSKVTQVQFTADLHVRAVKSGAMPPRP